MRDWPGLILNKRPVGDGFVVLDNVDYQAKGEVNPRPGLGSGTALTRSVLKVIAAPNAIGSNQIVALSGSTSSATLELLNLTTGASSSALSLGPVATTGGFTVTNDAAYWTDQTNGSRVLTTAGWRTMGIAAPSSSAPTTAVSAGGSVTSGTHLIRYRYYDSVRNRYSDPSGAAEVLITTARAATARFSAPAVDGRITSVTTEDFGEGYTSAPTVTIGSGGSTPVELYSAGIDTTSPLGALKPLKIKTQGIGYTTAPTLTIAAPTPAGNTIGVTVVASGDSSVDKIVIEMTLADGSEFFQAAKVSNAGATISVTMNDETLAVQNAAGDYTEDGYGHGVPPRFGILAAQRGRMFGWMAGDEAEDTLYWSRIGFPESWKPADWSRRVFGAQADKPAAMFTLSDDLYLLGQRSMYRLIYTNDPGTGLLVPLPTTFGAWNQQCVVEVEGGFYGFSPAGVWAINALQPRDIGAEIKPYIDASIDTTRSAEFFGWYDPVRKTVEFAFQTTSSGTRVVTWWIEEGKWTTASYMQGVSAACSVRWSDGLVNMVIFGGSRMFRPDLGKSDGAAATTACLVSTYSSGTLSLGSAHGMTGIGQLVVSRTGAQIAVTGTPTGASLTVATGLDIVAGDTVYCGGFNSTLTSEWVVGPKMDRGAAAYLQVESIPLGSTAALTVTMYADWASTPSVTYSADAGTLGVTVNSNNTCTLDMVAAAGAVKVPVPSTYTRALAFTLRAVAGSGTVRIIGAEINAKSPASE